MRFVINLIRQNTIKTLHTIMLILKKKIHEQMPEPARFVLPFADSYIFSDDGSDCFIAMHNMERT